MKSVHNQIIQHMPLICQIEVQHNRPSRITDTIRNKFTNLLSIFLKLRLRIIASFIQISLPLLRQVSQTLSTILVLFPYMIALHTCFWRLAAVKHHRIQSKRWYCTFSILLHNVLSIERTLKCCNLPSSEVSTRPIISVRRTKPGPRGGCCKHVQCTCIALITWYIEDWMIDQWEDNIRILYSWLTNNCKIVQQKKSWWEGCTGSAVVVLHVRYLHALIEEYSLMFIELRFSVME